MRKWLAFLLLLPVSALGGNTYEVTNVSFVKGKVKIEFETHADYYSMCELHPTRMEIDIGDLPLTKGKVTNGEINIETQLNIDDFCALAVGPNSGTVKLPKYHSLPGLLRGTYDLTIDSDPLGTLKVKAKNVVFTPL
jgi:hypothetical protein